MERRSALLVIGGGVIGGPLDAAQQHPVSLAGTVASYKLQFFSPEQNETIDRLAAMIIPPDDRSPGAREAQVSLFIDLMVANSGAAVQNEWLAGLSAVDKEVQARYGAAFSLCSAKHQEEILAIMAAHETDPSTDLERFFVRLKGSTVDGYYTSHLGIHQELRYQGNAVLSEFPGCKHPDHEI